MSEHPPGYSILRDQIEINPHKLDEEAIRQPTLILAICEKLADTAEQRDRLDNKLDHEKALLTRAISQDAADDKKRMTVDQIKAEVLRDRTIRDMIDELQTVQRHVAYWQGLLRAAEAKSSSMKRLGELMAAGYYASPSVRPAYTTPPIQRRERRTE